MDIYSNPYRRRWLGYAALAIAYFLVSVHQLSTAVLSEQLLRTFDMTGAELGLLHSSFFFLYAVLQVPAGLLTDRYGVRVIAAGGTGLMSLGAVVFGFAPVFSIAVFGRLLVGLGASVLFLAILRFCANWFRPSEFATMTGVTLAIYLFGGVAATTPVAVVIDATGWRMTMLGLGGISLGATATIVVLVHDTPADANLPAIENVPERPEVTFGELKGYVRHALGELETWLLGAMLFLWTGIGATIVGLWGIPFLVQSYEISVSEASVYIMAGSIAGVFAPTMFGWLSDRLGRRTDLIVVSTAAFAGTWGIFVVFGTIPLLFVGAVFVISNLLGGGVPLTYTVMRERYPSEASGTVIGMVNTMGWTGAAVFPILLGQALDRFWTGEMVDGTRVYTVFGYRVAFGIAFVAGLLAVICALVLHVRVRSTTQGLTDLSTEKTAEEPTD